MPTKSQPQTKNNMNKITYILSTIAITAVTISSATAAILVTNTSANILEDSQDSGTYTHTLLSWSLSGGNAVIVYFSGENTLGVTAKYGTEDLTMVETTGFGNDHVAAIGYIINPALSTANLDVTWAAQGNSENMITALSLENVGSVVASDTTGGNLSFSYTTTLDGGFVVGNATNNNFSGPSPTVTSDWLDTDVFNGTISGNASSIQTWGAIDTAGTYTDTYSDSTVSSGVAFEAVPEPSAFALIAGCFGLTWVMLRRRA